MWHTCVFNIAQPASNNRYFVWYMLGECEIYFQICCLLFLHWSILNSIEFDGVNISPPIPYFAPKTPFIGHFKPKSASRLGNQCREMQWWSRIESNSKVYVDLYSAFSQTPLMRSDMDHTVLPANNTISAFTPSRRAYHRPLARTHCAYPRRDGQAELTWVVG